MQATQPTQSTQPMQQRSPDHVGEADEDA